MTTINERRNVLTSSYSSSSSRWRTLVTARFSLVSLLLLLLLLLSTSICAMSTPQPPTPSTATIPSSSSSSFAVVGVGVLGTSLCRQILEAYPDCIVTGITKTTNHHATILDEVGHPYSTRLQLVASSGDNDNDNDDDNNNNNNAKKKFKNVVFCAPPSGFDDYPTAVQNAIATYWDSGGVFAYTSSGAVYGPGDSGIVTETSTLADISSSPRVARLVRAEQAVLKAGGCCLRLAGLYNLHRGPHNYWITKSGGVVESSPDGIINMLHYEDAAAACLAALQSGPTTCTGRAFLISDGNPISRYDMCKSALQASTYKDYTMPKFTATPDEHNNQQQPLGKVYNGSVSNAALSWSPKYTSFHAFMKANA